MRSFRGQLDLVRRAGSFRLLFLATLGSGVGTWLAFVALTVDVEERTDSGTWVAALLIADFVPMIVIGLALAPLVDRVSRRRLMIVSDLVRLGVFAALPFAPNAAAIVVLAGAAGFATGFFRPAVYAGLPNLVDAAELARANSLLQTIENATVTIAPVLGGVLVAAAGPDVAYIVNALTFLVSAVLVARIPSRQLEAPAGESGGHWRDLTEGFAVVRRSRALLTVLIAWNIAMLSIAGTNVSEVFLAKDSLNGGNFGFGLLVGMAGFGAAVGSFVAGPWIEHRSIALVYGSSLGLMAIGYATAAASPTVWVAAVCVALYGAGNGSAVVCNALLVQRGAPDRLRGRAFTVLMSSTSVTLAVGMIVAGPLTDAIGARWVWAAAAVTAALAAVVGYPLARSVRDIADSDDTEAQPALSEAPAGVPGDRTL